MTKKKKNKSVKLNPSDPERVSPAPHGWTKWGTILALLVSLGSLLVSFAGYKQAKLASHSNVKPDIFYTIRHNTSPQGKVFPFASEIVFLNKGPIKAASIYVSSQVFNVDTNYWWPYGTVGALQPYHNEYNFMLKELDTGEGKVKSIFGVGPLAIYVVNVTYYHPGDMTKYVERSIFLYDSGSFYDEIGFSQKSYYSILKKNLVHRLAGEKGEFPPGKTWTDSQNNGEFLLYVPDISETPRLLEEEK